MDNHQSPKNRSALENIFLSPDEPRLRAGWRLLLQSILLFLLGGCLSICLGLVLLIADPSLLDKVADLPPEYFLLGVVAEAIAVTTSVFLARRFLDKRSIES